MFFWKLRDPTYINTKADREDLQSPHVTPGLMWMGSLPLTTDHTFHTTSLAHADLTWQPPGGSSPLRSPLTLAGCWAPSSGRTGTVRRRWRCVPGRCRVLPAGSAADLLPARALRLLKRRHGPAITRCRCRRGSSWRRRPAGRWRPSARSWRFDCLLACLLVCLVRLGVGEDAWFKTTPELRARIHARPYYAQMQCCHSAQRYVTKPYALFFFFLTEKWPEQGSRMGGRIRTLSIRRRQIWDFKTNRNVRVLDACVSVCTPASTCPL